MVVVLSFGQILTRRCLAVLSVDTTRDECPRLNCSRNSNDVPTAPLARGEMMVVVVVVVVVVVRLPFPEQGLRLTWKQSILTAVQIAHGKSASICLGIGGFSHVPGFVMKSSRVSTMECKYQSRRLHRFRFQINSSSIKPVLTAKPSLTRGSVNGI